MKATVQVKNAKELENFLENEAPNIFDIQTLREIYMETRRWNPLDVTWIYSDLDELFKTVGTASALEMIRHWKEAPARFNDRPFYLEIGELPANPYEIPEHQAKEFTAETFKEDAPEMAQILFNSPYECGDILAIEIL